MPGQPRGPWRGRPEPDPELRDLSLVTSSCHVEGEPAFRLGVLGSPRVEYALTDKGRALLPMIEDMRCFGERWLDCNEPAASSDSVLTAPTA